MLEFELYIRNDLDEPCCGIPSVILFPVSEILITCKIEDTYHTTSGISAAIASSIPAAARGGLVTISALSSLISLEFWVFHTAQR
jgi:hypothetical protein